MIVRRPPRAVVERGTPRLELIVQESARLFDESGYANTSMAQIAAAVGLAKPSLYHYFDSKSDILVAIHESFIDRLIDKHADRRSAGVPPPGQLLGVMTDILELMETQRAYVRVFFEHHRELPRQARRSFMTKRSRYENMVIEIIARGCEDGYFSLGDPYLAALAVFGMCNWAYQWWVPGSGRSPEAVARYFAGIVLNGIRSADSPDWTIAEPGMPHAGPPTGGMTA
jgi:AcrR family transcriptional regulator